MHGINGGLMPAPQPNTCVGIFRSLPRSDLIFKVFIIYTLNLSIFIYVRSHDERPAAVATGEKRDRVNAST